MNVYINRVIPIPKPLIPIKYAKIFQRRDHFSLPLDENQFLLK